MAAEMPLLSCSVQSLSDFEQKACLQIVAHNARLQIGLLVCLAASKAIMTANRKSAGATDWAVTMRTVEQSCVSV